MATGDAPQITLRDYWRVVWRRKWVLVVAMLAALVPAVVLTALQTPVYLAASQMLVQSQSSVVLAGSSVGSSDPTRTIPNEVAIIEGELVAARVAELLGIDFLPLRARALSSSETDVITITVASTDAETTAIIANAYIQAYIDVKNEQKLEGITDAIEAVQGQISDLQEQIDELEAQIGGSDEDDAAALETRARFLLSQQDSYRQTLDQIQLEASLSRPAAQVVVPASVPTQPIEPRPFRTAMLALVIGAILGLAGVFLLDYFDQSIKRPEDLAPASERQPLLALVPFMPEREARPLAMSAPNHPAVEAYRGLRTNLQFLGLEYDIKVIQITSSMAGEGKTTTATNLAIVLSQAGARVLLIDADLRRPRIHQLMNCDATYGLTDNLTGESLEMTLTSIDDHLSVLPAGRIPSNPSEMLSSRTMSLMITSLRDSYDYVIIDSPPTLPVSDAVALARHADGVIVVVQAGRATVPEVQRTLDRLEQVSARVLGLVLTRTSKKSLGPYGYGYGYGYGPNTAATPLDRSSVRS